MLEENWIEADPEPPRWKVGAVVWTNEAAEVLRAGGTVTSDVTWSLRDNQVYIGTELWNRSQGAHGLDTWISWDFDRNGPNGMKYKIHSLPNK